MLLVSLFVPSFLRLTISHDVEKMTDDVMVRSDMRKALPRDVEGLSVKLPKGKKSGRDVITYP